MQLVDNRAQIAQIVVQALFVFEWFHIVPPTMEKECPAFTSRIPESQRLRDRTRRLLPSLHHKMSSPILLVAGFRMFIAKRPLFPVRHHGQTIRTDTEFDQIIPNGFRPFLTKYEVIGGGPPLVTVPLDLDQC